MFYPFVVIALLTPVFGGLLIAHRDLRQRLHDREWSHCAVYMLCIVAWYGVAAIIWPLVFEWASRRTPASLGQTYVGLGFGGLLLIFSLALIRDAVHYARRADRQRCIASAVILFVYALVGAYWIHLALTSPSGP